MTPGRRTASEVVTGADLAYVSDYWSFVGSDDQGEVAFALDDNRGYDADLPVGQRFQAEHAYAVLHAEGTGWVPLVGAQRIPNAGGELLRHPASVWFDTAGDPDTGGVVSSPRNDLVLEVEPLVDRLVRGDDATLFVMRTAAAVLRWRGRTVPGRVIAEHLATNGMNLLSRRTFAGLAGLEFLYLRTGDGRDLYLQKTLGSGMAGMEPELGFLAGPADPIDASVELPDLRIVTTGHRAAVGLHRWPTSWRATWTGGSAELATTTRTSVGRYGIAGFAMSVVAGQLILGETRTPLSGFGELLALGPLAKMLA